MRGTDEAAEESYKLLIWGTRRRLKLSSGAGVGGLH
jgi:hypothetical protein